MLLNNFLASNLNIPVLSPSPKSHCSFLIFATKNLPSLHLGVSSSLVFSNLSDEETLGIIILRPDAQGILK